MTTTTVPGLLRTMRLYGHIVSPPVARRAVTAGHRPPRLCGLRLVLSAYGQAMTPSTAEAAPMPTTTLHELGVPEIEVLLTLIE